VSEYASALLKERLGLKVRLDRPNYLQRCFMICASPVDLEEAYRVGRQAVIEAVAGRPQGMITLVRDAGPDYHCSTGVAALEGIANQEKRLPAEFMNRAGNSPSEAFVTWARPLIGEPWPPQRYVRLAKHFV
jgi:6-phosphofructokinase 1